MVLAYETWGELNAARANAIYIAHALTGDSHVWGPASLHPDDGLPWGSRFPYVTMRDMVAAEIALADHLGIDRWRLITGPSMGGMRAIEWAVTVPDRVGTIATVGSAAATTADQIAWSTSQVAAVLADPNFRGSDYYDAADGDGPHVGLGIARMIGHTTYRSEGELAERFGLSFQGDGDPIGKGGLFAVQSYLQHHGRKLARRFDANTYVRLAQAIQSHDVGRGRGGVETARARYTGPGLVIAVDSDRLYPLKNSQLLDLGLSGSHGVKVVHSPVGHDGYLVESGRLNAFIAEFEAGL